MERRGSLIVISAPRQTWGYQTPPCFFGGFCWQGENGIYKMQASANKNQTLIWPQPGWMVGWYFASLLALIGGLIWYSCCRGLIGKIGQSWKRRSSCLQVGELFEVFFGTLLVSFWKPLIGKIWAESVCLSKKEGCQEKKRLIRARSYWRDPPHWRTMTIHHWSMIINQRPKGKNWVFQTKLSRL